MTTSLRAEILRLVGEGVQPYAVARRLPCSDALVYRVLQGTTFFGGNTSYRGYTTKELGVALEYQQGRLRNARERVAAIKAELARREGET